MEQLFMVSFFKKLVDSTGHPFDTLQGAVEVRGNTKTCVVDEARRKFAEVKDVADWSLRADYEVVELTREDGR